MTKIATTGIETAPRPRPGVLGIDPYVPGQSSAPGAPRFSSFRQMRHRSGLRPAPAKPCATLPTISRIIRMAPPPSCARRSAQGMGSIRPESSAATARMKSSISSPPPISVRAMKAFLREHGFLVYKIAILAAGGVPIVAGETNLTADVPIKSWPRSGQGPRWSSSPIRTIRPAPICRSPRSSVSPCACQAMCCSFSTRPMPNM